MQQECGNPSGNHPIVHKSWECRDRATKLPHDALRTKTARHKSEVSPPASCCARRRRKLHFGALSAEIANRAAIEATGLSPRPRRGCPPRATLPPP
jgi:hypothetical protein